MDYLTDGNILLVGDGDFSFSIALSKYQNFQAHCTTSSSLETEASISVHAQAAENMAALKEMGVLVCLETDARELHTHASISLKRYERIIFNFPLAARHHIKTNRALLADFFLSCSQIISPGGKVMVTLCKGQGGTPADQPIRSWHDSWQIVAMATNAGFLLQNVTPFDPTLFPEYHSVGFRFQDKSFNTLGGLIHVFEMADLIKDTDSSVRGTVAFNNEVFSCSSYVADKMRRDLLSEPTNPTAILKSNLEISLNKSLNSCSMLSSPPFLLPGFRSLVHIDNEDNAIAESASKCGQGDSGKGDDKLEKERKNHETLDNLRKVPFAHGVESAALREKNGKENLLIHLPFLPIDNEHVFILIRNSKETVKRYPHTDPSSVECGDENEGGGMSITPSFSGDSQSSPVFHHRVSLLENIPQICDELVEKHSERLAKPQTDTNSESLSHNDTNQENSLHARLSEANGHNPGSPITTINTPICCVVSGQSILPGPICKDFLPTRHELVIVHSIQEHTLQKLGNDADQSEPSQLDIDNLSLQTFNSISIQIITALQKSTLLSHRFSISLQPCDSVKILIQGIDQSIIKSYICVQPLDADVSKMPEPLTIGHIIHAQKGYCPFHIALLNISDIACELWKIEDTRLLWCTQDKFVSHFQSAERESNLQPLKPLCLYPMKFAHDISFWVKEDTEFDVFSFYDVIRNIAFDLVVQVTLTDSYIDSVSKRKSLCYRLHFESRSQALPYSTSWKLQSRIRMEVSQSLGVTLR